MYDEGDCNCSETGYAIPNHKDCEQAGRIIPEKLLDPNGKWRCACKTDFEAMISL